MEAFAITDSCPTCGTSISQARLAEIRKRLDSEQRKLQSTMRAELALEHKQALEEREAELRRDLIAEAEREKEAALARQRKLLEGERDSAKTELANIRSELDHVRSKFEEDLAAANGRAAKLEQERSDGISRKRSASKRWSRPRPQKSVLRWFASVTRRERSRRRSRRWLRSERPSCGVI